MTETEERPAERIQFTIGQKALGALVMAIQAGGLYMLQQFPTKVEFEARSRIVDSGFARLEDRLAVFEAADLRVRVGVLEARLTQLEASK